MKSENICKEWRDKSDYECGYNTAEVIIKQLGFEEAKKAQSTLVNLGRSDKEIIGYTQALIDYAISLGN